MGCGLVSVFGVPGGMWDFHVASEASNNMVAKRTRSMHLLKTDLVIFGATWEFRECPYAFNMLFCQLSVFAGTNPCFFRVFLGSAFVAFPRNLHMANRHFSRKPLFCMSKTVIGKFSQQQHMFNAFLVWAFICFAPKHKSQHDFARIALIYPPAPRLPEQNFTQLWPLLNTVSAFPRGVAPP